MAPPPTVAVSLTTPFNTLLPPNSAASKPPTAADPKRPVAPFVVPVIHFCFDFRSRHILSALSRSPRGWAKTEKNSLMHTQSPINPTRSTRRWTAVARRPDCPPLGLPPDPQRPGRNRTAPPPSPWPSPRGQGPGG